MRGAKIESFVDDYYSVAKFRAAYAGALPTMTDRHNGSKSILAS
jgi:hypothetical protein